MVEEQSAEVTSVVLLLQRAAAAIMQQLALLFNPPWMGLTIRLRIPPSLEGSASGSASGDSAEWWRWQGVGGVALLTAIAGCQIVFGGSSGSVGNPQSAGSRLSATPGWQKMWKLSLYQASQVRLGLGLGWFGFVALLLPTLGFVQHGSPVLTADRYGYLPALLIGVPLLAHLSFWLTCICHGIDVNAAQTVTVRHALATARDGTPSDVAMVTNQKDGSLSNRSHEAVCGSKQHRATHPPVLMACSWAMVQVSVVAILTLHTRAYASVWRNSETLWRHVAALDPADARAWSDLSSAILERDIPFSTATTEALRAYEQAIVADPLSGDIWANYGLVLGSNGIQRRTEALHCFLQATTPPRRFDNSAAAALAHRNWAVTILSGAVEAKTAELRTMEALVQLETAVQLTPCHPAGLARLAVALGQVGRHAEEARRYEQAIELLLQPGGAAMAAVTGATVLVLQDSSAREELRRLLPPMRAQRLKVTASTVTETTGATVELLAANTFRLNRAVAFQRLRRYTEAAAEYQAILIMEPKYDRARSSYAALLRKMQLGMPPTAAAGVAAASAPVVVETVAAPSSSAGSSSIVAASGNDDGGGGSATVAGESAVVLQPQRYHSPSSLM